MLSGPAFSLSYAVAGLFMGTLIQRFNRRNLLAGACIIWSLSSVLSGLTSSFAVIFLMRFILGLFVSATEPVGFALLGDYFPIAMRTTANSLVSTATYIGGASSVQYLITTQAFGWRAAYLISGVFGLIAGIISLLVIKDPKKGLQKEIEQEQSQYESDYAEEDAADGEESHGGLIADFKKSLSDLMKHPVGFWATCAAMFRYIGIFAADYYGPMWFLRYYPSHSKSFTICFPLAVLFCGFFSGLIGGIVSDRLGKKSHMTKAWVCIVG